MGLVGVGGWEGALAATDAKDDLPPGGGGLPWRPGLRVWLESKNWRSRRLSCTEMDFWRSWR